MSLDNITSIPHLHAATRRQDLMIEADKVRLLNSVRADRPVAVVVRRQLGSALIRAGVLVRGPLAQAA